MNLRIELYVASGLIAFCLINYFYLIPTQVIAEGSSPTYPLLTNSLLLVFSLAYLWEGLHRLRKDRRQRQENEDQAAASEEAARQRFYWRRPVALLVLCAVWLQVMEAVGFIVSTFFFLLLATRIFATRGLIKSLVFSLVMPVVLYALFRSLGSLLPQGPLERWLETFLS